MIRRKISSAIDDLNTLNVLYPWIPSEHTIRPRREDLEAKWATLDRIEREWPSMKEYIRVAVLKESENEWVFSPSIFRYNLPAYAQHWVLWNMRTDYSANFHDETINTVLNEFLASQGATDFAWYKNPKPSVPEYYHVQVFWI